MELINPELYYEYHAKEYAKKFRNYSDAAVKDNRNQIGNEPDIQVRIEKEKKGRRFFSVSMSISGLGETIVAKKAGKNVVQLIKKVKKLLLNRFQLTHRKKNKPIRGSKGLLAS